MPFKSEAQRRYLYSQHPDIAERFAEHTPTNVKLPEKLHKQKKNKKHVKVAAAPPQYGAATNPSVSCGACKHYNGLSGLCDLYDTTVDRNAVCASFVPIQELTAKLARAAALSGKGSVPDMRHIGLGRFAPSPFSGLAEQFVPSIHQQVVLHQKQQEEQQKQLQEAQQEQSTTSQPPTPQPSLMAKVANFGSFFRGGANLFGRIFRRPPTSLAPRPSATPILPRPITPPPAPPLTSAAPRPAPVAPRSAPVPSPTPVAPVSAPAPSSVMPSAPAAVGGAVAAPQPSRFRNILDVATRPTGRALERFAPSVASAPGLAGGLARTGTGAADRLFQFVSGGGFTRGMLDTGGRGFLRPAVGYGIGTASALSPAINYALGDHDVPNPPSIANSLAHMFVPGFGLGQNLAYEPGVSALNRIMPSSRNWLGNINPSEMSVAQNVEALSNVSRNLNPFNPVAQARYRNIPSAISAFVNPQRITQSASQMLSPAISTTPEVDRSHTQSLMMHGLESSQRMVEAANQVLANQSQFSPAEVQDAQRVLERHQGRLNQISEVGGQQILEQGQQLASVLIPAITNHASQLASNLGIPVNQVAAAIASNTPNNPVSSQGINALRVQLSSNNNTPPNNPTIMQQAQNLWSNMDVMSRWLVLMGGGLGLISALSSLTGEGLFGNLTPLMSLAGLGTAAYGLGRMSGWDMNRLSSGNFWRGLTNSNTPPASGSINQASSAGAIGNVTIPDSFRSSATNFINSLPNMPPHQAGAGMVNLLQQLGRSNPSIRHELSTQLRDLANTPTMFAGAAQRRINQVLNSYNLPPITDVRSVQSLISELRQNPDMTN